MTYKRQAYKIKDEFHCLLLYNHFPLHFLINLHFLYSSQRDSHGKPLDVNRTDFHLKGPFDNQIDPKNNLETSLKVWPEEVENAGQVTILWEGIPNPTSGDRIGYYCPYYDNPAHGLDYIDVTKSPTWEEGYGYYTVKLYNMRSPCAFRYYSGGKKLVAISNKVRFTNGDAFAPLQVHLAMTNNPTEMRVIWNSAKGIARFKSFFKVDVLSFVSFC